MKQIARLSLILIIPVFVISCVEPIWRFSKDDQAIQAIAIKQSWKKIAILPFTGDPAFRRPAAEWLASLVAEHGLFEIIDPGRAEVELKRKGIVAGVKDFQNEEAVKAGRLLGVDAVITGSILAPKKPPDDTNYPLYHGPQVPLAANIIDVATGKVIASSFRSRATVWKGANISFYSHVYVMATAGDIAEDFLPVLYAAAGRPWTPPSKEDPSSGSTL